MTEHIIETDGERIARLRADAQSKLGDDQQTGTTIRSIIPALIELLGDEHNQRWALQALGSIAESQAAAVLDVINEGRSPGVIPENLMRAHLNRGNGGESTLTTFRASGFDLGNMALIGMHLENNGYTSDATAAIRYALLFTVLMLWTRDEEPLDEGPDDE
jgi:hypothetical protein